MSPHLNNPPRQSGLSSTSAAAPTGGGSAFPHDAQATGLGGYPTAPGVSRLEWYAAQFIAPLIASAMQPLDNLGCPVGLPEPEAVAAHAFDYAEAMIAEANRRHLNPKDTP